jgi:hypothetical protein
MKWISSFAAVAAFSACALDERAQVGSVELEVTSERDPDEALRELVELYDELTARMDERGVTPEQMQAAVDAGDSERVRALLGYTREEYATANARALALLACIMATRESAAVDGLRCDSEILECGSTFFFAAWAQPQFGLGILAAGAVICGIADCRWNDGSGPRTKQP